MANHSTRLVHTTGMDGITSVLQGLPKEVRTSILAEAVDQGAVPMVVAAKRNARRSIRTGALYLAIGSRVKKYPHSAAAVAVVGVRRGYYRNRVRLTKASDFAGADSPSHYGHLIEYGHHQVVGGSLRQKYSRVLTKTGAVSARGKPIKRWKRGAVLEKGKGTKVKFVQPRPFLRPAFISSRGAVQMAMLNGINKGIEKTRDRLVKKGEHSV